MARLSPIEKDQFLLPGLNVGLKMPEPKRVDISLEDTPLGRFASDQKKAEAEKDQEALFESTERRK